MKTRFFFFLALFHVRSQFHSITSCRADRDLKYTSGWPVGAFDYLYLLAEEVGLRQRDQDSEFALGSSMVNKNLTDGIRLRRMPPIKGIDLD